GIDDAAAGLDEESGAIEHGDLLLDALGERARPDAPFRIGVAPPHAGAGARRIDQDEIGAIVQIGKHVGADARRAYLDVARAGAAWIAGLLAPAPNRMRSPDGDQRVGTGPRFASAAATCSRSALRVFTRRSSGAREASAESSSPRSSPNVLAKCASSQSG